MGHLFLLTAILFIGLTGCTPTISSLNLNSSSTGTTSSVGASPTVSVPSGVKAIKIILQQSAGGSFGTTPTALSHGTPPAPGSGFPATQIFNTDGTVLATGGSSSASWPTWLSSFEIGISGTKNTSSPNPNCAGFASNTESTTANCLIGPTGSTTSNCGAPSGMFRVSEADCFLSPSSALAGTGGPSDGIYFRATFNRSSSALGSNENILVVLEYSAAAVSSAPSNPANCFSGGTASVEACSEFVWRAYLKHSASETVQPFLLLVPPTFSSLFPAGVTTLTAGAASQNSGIGFAAKQFILPLASDSTLTVLQISRTGGTYSGSKATVGDAAYNLYQNCALGSLPANSPLCAGMVFYSITFYRI